MKELKVKSEIKLLNEKYALHLINEQLPSIQISQVDNLFKYTSENWKDIYLIFQRQGGVEIAFLIKCIFQDLDWGVLKKPLPYSS